MRGYLVALVVLAAVLSASFSLHLAAATTIQQVGNASLYIFGVTTEANGSTVGVPAQLSLTVTEGSGKVFLGSTPLTGTDTQSQAVVSAYLACELVNVNCDNYNFYYYIQSSSSQISGPSAGAAFAIAAMSVLTNHSLSSGVAMTGTANPDGSIGIVGDVAAKSIAAADMGITLFLYPANEPNSSSDNITQQAIAYDAAKGMSTKAVSSVYAAYQYFTGYNITPALDYNVTTPLYRSLMLATYSNFSAYQQAVYDSLPSSNTSNATIRSLINTALASIQQEDLLVYEGDYYTAASYIVNTSATNLVYARTLEEMNVQSDPAAYLAGLISAENSSIQQTYMNVTKGYVTNAATLDLKFIAIDRLSQASIFLDNASSNVPSNLMTAAYFYALSEVKRASAPFWMSIVPRGVSNFSESSYYNMSQYYLYKASSYLNYANLLNPSAGSSTSSELQLLFSQAQVAQNQGNYIASVFDSLETIATSELIIEENSIVTNGSVSAVTNQILTSALRAINAAENAGVTPFLGISYYQFGQNFVNTSLSFFIQYESESRVYTNFETSLANASVTKNVGVFQPVSVSTPFNIEYLLYALFGVVFGIAVGGVIYEYRLFSMVKNRKIGKSLKIVVVPKAKHRTHPTRRHTRKAPKHRHR